LSYTRKEFVAPQSFN